jgi:hypothetical protein
MQRSLIRSFAAVPYEFRQLGDIRRDPLRLVAGEQLDRTLAHRNKSLS